MNLIKCSKPYLFQKSLRGLVFVALTLVHTINAFAQNGCTDPLANNFDASAVSNDGSCTYNSANISPHNSVVLSSTLNENSGLILWDNELWTHLDGGNPTDLYNIDISDLNNFSTTNLSSLSNIDWEDIAQDEDYIYLGDFGNNANGNRTNLKIYRIEKNSIELGSPMIEEINFSYADQVDFTPQGGNNTDFDCEAMIVTDNNIFLFTKEWVSQETTMYSLPKTPGTYSAVNEGSYDVNGLITGATYVDNKQVAVLSGYSNTLQPFIFLLYDFTGVDFFNGNKRKIGLNLAFHQVEGIASQDGLNYFISNEFFSETIPILGTITTQPQIHNVNLSDYLGNYLGLNNSSSQFAMIAEFDNNFNSTRLFEDAPYGDIKTLTVQATSNDDAYVIYYDNFTHKWQNNPSTFDDVFTIFYGDNTSPDGILNSPTTTGNYYSIQIDGFDLSDRQAVIMETDNLPVDFDVNNPVSGHESYLQSGQDFDITINLESEKSPQERAFVRYSDDAFATSNVAEVSFAGPTSSSGTATIPASFNTDGKTVEYYVYTTTVAATAGSNHDLITLYQANNQGNNYSYSVLACCFTVADGNSNASSTWVGGNLPPPAADIIINHDVVLSGNYQANTVEVTPNGSLTDIGSFILTINNNGGITNNGVFELTSSTIQFNADASVDGTNPRIFNNVNLFNFGLVDGVNFGAQSIINGTLTINQTAFVDLGSPIYGPDSILRYNNGGFYNRRSEWSNANASQGNPNHVIINPGTELNLGSENKGNPAVLNGNLTIESGGFIYMDVGSGPVSDDMEDPLVVGGNLVNQGTIILSDLPGGDLALEGDFTNADGATLDFNNRALIFQGGVLQQYNTPNQQLEIPFLVLNKNAGEVVLNNNVSVVGNGPGLQMQDNGILNLNDNNLVLGETGTSTTVSFTGNAALKGSDSSILTLKGNANMGDITFDQTTLGTSNALGNIFLEKNAGSDVGFSNPVHLKEGITLTSGTLNSNGNLVFVSDATNTAIVREVPTSGGDISNDVVIQRHFPLSGLQRSFRYISPSVETSTSIHANWQEGATTGNFDPEPGFGTHITGAQGPVGQVSSNGFDMTETGNYSLYTWNEISQQWDPFTSTIDDAATVGTVENTLEIEDAFALMVRGDRSATLLSNTDEGSNPATIRTRGTIHTGNFSYNFNSPFTSGDLDKFVLVGNPYQSQVDMSEVFANTSTTGVNTNFVWVWDPTITDKGAYAVVDLSSGVPEDINGLPSSSDANEFLQPFQAVFVQVNASGAQVVNFEENDKDNATPQTTVFIDQEYSNASKIEINLVNTTDNEIVDAVRFNFEDNYIDTVTYEDAVKFWNYDENFAILENDKYLSIDKRTLPTGEKVIPLFISGYNSNDYTLDFELTNLPDTVNLYLEDTYLNTLTPLDTNQLEYQFTLDFSIPESYDAQRFRLVFNPQTLSDDRPTENNEFSIYPNPTSDLLYINIPEHLVGHSAGIQCFDMAGRQVSSTKVDQLKTENTLDLNHLSQGLYLIKIETKNGIKTFKMQIRR
jgi:hypothetical protein